MWHKFKKDFFFSLFKEEGERSYESDLSYEKRRYFDKIHIHVSTCECV